MESGFSRLRSPDVVYAAGETLGAVVGSLAGFLFSGIIHELAISVPAGAGYGWPTLYFIIQGLAVVVGRKLRTHGWLNANSLASRIWTIVIVASPAPLLFHQAFVIKVINPIVRWCDIGGYFF